MMKKYIFILLLLGMVGCSSQKNNETIDSVQEKKVPTITENEKKPNSIQPTNPIKEKEQFGKFNINFSLDANILNSNLINDVHSSVKEISTPFYLKGNFYVKKGLIITSTDLKNGKLIPLNLPDSIIYNSSSKVIYYRDEENSSVTAYSLKDKKSSYDKERKFSDYDGLSIYLYFQINLKNGFKNYYASINKLKAGKVESQSWEVLAFSEDGHIISSMHESSEFFVIDDKIVSISWYASDPDPYYVTWTQDDQGYFHLTSFVLEMPGILKKYKAVMRI